MLWTLTLTAARTDSDFQVRAKPFDLQGFEMEVEEEVLLAQL